VWTYTPPPTSYVGSDSFVITSSDVNNNEETKTITVTVSDTVITTTNSGTSPAAIDVGSTSTGTITASDVNANISFSVSSDPTYGSVSVAVDGDSSSTSRTATWTYTASRLSTSFTITATDGNASVDTAISITVNAAASYTYLNYYFPLYNINYSSYNNRNVSVGASTGTDSDGYPSYNMENIDILLAFGWKEMYFDYSNSTNANPSSFTPTYDNGSDQYGGRETTSSQIGKSAAGELFYEFNGVDGVTENMCMPSVGSTRGYSLTYPGDGAIGSRDADGYPRIHIGTNNPLAAAAHTSTEGGENPGTSATGTAPLNVYMSFTHPDHTDTNTVYYPWHSLQNGQNFGRGAGRMIHGTYPEFWTAETYAAGVTELQSIASYNNPLRSVQGTSYGDNQTSGDGTTTLFDGMFNAAGDNFDHNGSTDVNVSIFWNDRDAAANNLYINGGGKAYEDGDTTEKGTGIAGYHEIMYLYAGPQTYFSTATGKVTSLQTVG
jgi:hypothetical protein